MIKIKHLVKDYEKKKQKTCRALDDINLTLPDKGFIFIIGKSGSGKSTLLNLIGGLDKITKGDIKCDNISVKALKGDKLDAYLAKYIGFIFQDYHLIDGLTVEQNMDLALDIASEKADIEKALSDVGLAGYGKKYPKELSGGEKQRVAVARALIKAPKFILADEPTGNLDKASTQQVLDLLQAISREKLVIIVSHNLADADKYATRIIELSEGKVITDRSREEGYNNTLRIENNILYLPHHHNLNQADLKLLKQKPKPYRRIIQIGDGFVESINEGEENGEYVFTIKRLDKTKKRKLFRNFYCKKWLSKFLTAFMAALLLTITYICLSFVNFNVNDTLVADYEAQNATSIRFQKGSKISESLISVNNFYPVMNDELQAFTKNYKGNVYHLYTHYITISDSNVSAGLNPGIMSTFKNLYARNSYGVLNCNADYLLDLYGVNGELEVLAGDLDAKESGLIITDYLADSMLKYLPTRYQSYDDIIGYLYSQKNYKTNYVNAIIKTGYREKYAEVLALADAVIAGSFDKATELENHKDYSTFVNDAFNHMAVTYNLADNYVEALQKEEHLTYIYLNGVYFSSGEVKKSSSGSVYVDVENKWNLNDGEIRMTTAHYNAIFGTNYNKDNLDEFTPHSVTITKYGYNKAGDVYKDKDFKIVSLVSSSVSEMYVNYQTFNDILAFDIYSYALYFDDLSTAYYLLEVAKDLNYTIQSIDNQNLQTISRIIAVFGKVIYIIFLIVGIACVFYLVGIGNKNIKNNLYEIGILKALGCNGKDIRQNFVLQNLAYGVIVLILTFVGIVIGSYVANEILLASLYKILGLKFRELTLIQVYPLLTGVMLGISMLIILIASIIPTSYLAKVRAIDVLKAKE